MPAFSARVLADRHAGGSIPSSQSKAKQLWIFSHLSSHFLLGLLLVTSRLVPVSQAQDFSFNGDVRAIFPLPDGGTLVGGAFTSVNGVSRAGLARLRPDDNLDTSFDPAGLSGVVLTVAQTEYGDVLVGGNILGIEGVRSGLFRLDGGGHFRDVFNRTVRKYDFTDPVSRIYPATGNQWWVAGSYSQQLAPFRFGFNGIDKSTVHLVGADGQLLPLQENSIVEVKTPIWRRINGGLIAIAVGPAGSRETNQICLIDAVGRLETLLPINTNLARAISITALAETVEGKIYTGKSPSGIFTGYRLYRFNPDGTTDTTFVQTNRFKGGTLTSLLPLSDGRLLVGGSFTNVAGQPCLGLAMFEADGTFTTAEKLQLNGTVLALEQTANGDVLLGGAFTQLNGQPALHYARLSGLARSPPFQIGFEQGTVLVPETATNATAVVHRTGSTTGDVRVGYHVQAGSGTSGTDFQETAGVLVFADGGAVAQSIQVSLNAQNDRAEGDRTIVITLDALFPGQLELGHSQSVILIQDDDQGALAELHSLEYLSNSVASPTFASLDFTHPLLTRVDREINFDWAYSAPVTGTQDRFAVRWRALLVPPVTGQYVFYSTTDDGCQLWVNGQRLINFEESAVATENRGSNALVMGQPVQLEFEFYDTYLHAAARLEWSTPGLPRQVIPETALRPLPFFENALSTNDFGAVVTNSAVPVFHHALAREGGSVGYTLTADGQTIQSGQIDFLIGQSVAWLPLPLFSAKTTDTNWLLTLHDAHGGVISKRLTTSVLRFLPLVVEGPTNRTLVSGVPLNLRAARFGAGHWSYQWQHNGIALPMATSSFLSIASPAPDDSGSYQLIARTDTSVFTSAVIQVTVTTPPIPPQLSISGPTPNGQLTLTINVAGSQPVILESSADLEDWQPLTTLPGTGAILHQTAGQSAQFYRARNKE